MELQQILDVSVQVGFYLLQSGAETFRVEQSIQYICHAYGIQEVDAFAIPATLIVTISDGEQFLTKTKRTKYHQIDLDKVEQLADLSRHICNTKLNYEEIQKQIQIIMNRPAYPPAWIYVGNAFAVMMFTLFFGGNLLDAFISLFVGVIITGLTRYLRKIELNPFFVTLVSGFFAGLIPYLLATLTTQIHADKIIIGVIMLMVPGVALANSIRDFLASDIVAGLSRMAEALLIAIGIAVGVMLAMVLVQGGGLQI